MTYHEKINLFASALDESWETQAPEAEIMVVVTRETRVSNFANVTVKDSVGVFSTFTVATSPALRTRAALWAEQQDDLLAEHARYGNDERV